MEEVSVVTGGGLHLYFGDVEWLHAELIQNLRKNGLDAFKHHVLVLSEIHQNARPTVFVIDDTAVCMWRNHFAGVEVGFVFPRETGEFLKFLGRQEFIQNHTLRG
jgi:hypothetical protein